MSDKLNILIASSYWPGVEMIGGVAEMASVLARELGKQHHVAVLINTWEEPTLRHVQEDGIDVISYRLRPLWHARRPVRNVVRWLLQSVRELTDIGRMLRDHGIDIIHIRYPEPEFFIFRILKFFGGPRYCISFHGSEVLRYHEHDWFSRVLLKRLIVGASASCAVSRSLAVEAEELFSCPGEVHTIHNGKSISEVVGTVSRSKVAHSRDYPKPYFVNPANVSWVKGQDVLIRAWAMLPTDVERFHLLIAGEAREAWEPCRRLIEDLGVGDRVHFLGPLPQSELFAVMQDAKGCIMSSRHEGFSGSVLEAGALALGVICTDIPSFREIVRHGENGLIAASEDPHAMAHAVADPARDPALACRLGEALRNDVRIRFSVEKMTEDFVALYRDVVFPGQRSKHQSASDNYPRGETRS